MGRYDLDVKDLHKIPAPPKPTWFDEELARLMPRSSFGEPFLKMEWGMDAVQFRNGNPNAPLVVAAHEKTVKRTFRRLDLVEGVFEYFDTRDEAVKALNVRLGPVIDYKDNREVVLYGPPRWMLVGWLAAERFGTPEAWERNRYGNVNVRGGKRVRVDCNGPYPARGQYRHVWTVEGPNGEYRELDRGVMIECERLVTEHKKLIAEQNDHTDAQELRDEISSLIAADREEQKRTEEEFLDFMGPSRYRLVEGNAWSGAGGTAASQARALPS